MKGKYTAVVKRLEENGKKRQALFPQIESVMVDFAKERSNSHDTSERAKVTCTKP